MLLDGSADGNVGDPLCGALVNLPIALSMPGLPETVFILIVVVLLFGAKKLPELARGLGQALGEFKKARDEFEREILNATTAGERQKVGGGASHARHLQIAQSASGAHNYCYRSGPGRFDPRLLDALG